MARRRVENRAPRLYVVGAPSEPEDRLALADETATWERIERLSWRLTERSGADLVEVLASAWRLMDRGGFVGLAAQRVLHAVETEVWRRALTPWRPRSRQALEVVRASASRKPRTPRK